MIAITGFTPTEEYLDRLKGQLKDLSAEEQAELLEEIASHLESGQTDPRVGEQQALAELGSPEDLGRNLRGIHRPNRWPELLLAVLPTYLFSPLISLLISALYGPLSAWSPAEPHLYLGGRIAILAALALALVGRQRRSIELTLFWLSSGLATLISLMTREARFIPGREAAAGAAIAGTWIESLGWYALLVGLSVWLARVLSRQRFDRLLTIFTLFPLLLALANYSTAQIMLQSQIPSQPASSLQFGLAGILFRQAAWVLGMALFFLLPQRDLRWLGLLLVAYYYASPNLSEYQASLPIRLIWASWLSLVIIFWFLDWRKRWKARAGRLMLF